MVFFLFCLKILRPRQLNGTNYQWRLEVKSRGTCEFRNPHGIVRIMAQNVTWSASQQSQRCTILDIEQAKPIAKRDASISL